MTDITYSMPTLPESVRDGNTVNRRIFHAWSDWCDAMRVCDSYYTSHCRKAGYSNEETSFEDAVKMATGDGFQAALPNVEALIGHVLTDMDERTMTSFETYFDVAGAEVDMGRYLAGEPECMLEARPLKVMRTGRVLKVVVPVNCQSGVHAQTILARGAAVVALVSCFARLQHTVEIWAAVTNCDRRGTTGNKNTRQQYLVKVQDSDQPLNMGRVMFALSHPAMPRQMGYAMKDHDYKVLGTPFGDNHGFGGPPRSVELADLDAMHVNAANAIILSDFDSGETWTVDYSVKWIRDQLERVERMSRWIRQERMRLRTGT